MRSPSPLQTQLPQQTTEPEPSLAQQQSPLMAASFASSLFAHIACMASHYEIASYKAAVRE